MIEVCYSQTRCALHGLCISVACVLFPANVKVVFFVWHRMSNYNVILVKVLQFYILQFSHFY